MDDILYFTDALTNASVSAQDAKKRVFKVVKYPVSPENEPSKIREQLAYNLFNVNTENGFVNEFRDFFSAEAENNYWIQMVNLAYDMQEVLDNIKETEGRKEKSTIGVGKHIYLAETSNDLILQRNIIKRELQKYGYKILPDRNLPSNMLEMESIIKKDLENCQMSIHLIGNTYGDVPKGSDISVLEIQNKFAAERSHLSAFLQKTNDDPAFSRLIWLTPDLNAINDKQYNFIENLKKDIESEDTAEMVQTPIEDFKSIIRRQLIEDVHTHDRNIKFKADQSRRQINGQVYFIYDKVDRNAVEPILEYIKNKEFDVSTPLFEGNLLDIQKQHIENLKMFDIAIVYQGFVSEQWVKMKILDLLKAPGYGRKKPIFAKALIAGRGAKNYDFAESFDVEIIDNTLDFSSDDLDLVLSQAT
ncbi:MAG: DUF4062 domain-containing protein [Verrucomicrobia bacterium]|nr:DUF4062 domain-containing protein [Cytophagales bacterium]